MRKVVDEAITRRATRERDDSARGAPNTPVEERMNPEQQEDDGLKMRFSDNESKDTLVM